MHTLFVLMWCGRTRCLNIELMTSQLLCPDLCPECSYPQLSPGRCYFCLSEDETSVIVLTTARRPRERRAEDERRLPTTAASAFAAVG